MIWFSKKRESPLLLVTVNGEGLCSVAAATVPCESTPTMHLQSSSVLELTDAQGVSHQHVLGDISGWFHFSIRVHSNLACQVDCVITDERDFDPDAFSKGRAKGIRFQPFFISGAKVTNDVMRGRGLFARGLHFSGSITPGNIILSCECDRCKRSFQISSFHCGFSNVGYFYSGSGTYTITVSDRIPGCPAALYEPDPTSLLTLEAKLPLAPDGTSYKYTNPFRCPHCFAPYIDFEAHPTERLSEYYGSYFVGSEVLHYEPSV